MKILLTFAASIAALTSMPATASDEKSGGHYEWQNRSVYGLNKSNIPTRVRVWVNGTPKMANCDCTSINGKSAMPACMDMPKRSIG